MSKRKKIKKVGSATRNIQKIATVLGIVPLVTMSSFLFHDTYALAGEIPPVAPVQLSKTLNLSESDYLKFRVEELFPNFDGYYLNGSVSVKDSFTNTELDGTMEYGSFYINGKQLLNLNCLDIYLYDVKPGSYTITITPDYSGYGTATSFTFAVIEPAFVNKELDIDHDGLDIGDIIKAVNNTNASDAYKHAADANGDGLVNQKDYAELMKLISPSSNNQPTVIAPIPDQDFTLFGYENKRKVILEQHFTDSDLGNDLIYRVYNDAPITVTAAITTTFSSSSASLYESLNTYAVNNGTTTVTVVADDQKGGYATTSFTARKVNNNAPTVNNAVYLNDLVLNDGGNYNQDISTLFTDLDGEYDPLNYTYQSSVNSENAVVNLSGGYLSIEGKLTTGSNLFPLTVKATDGSGANVSRSFNTQVIQHVFRTNTPADDFLKIANYFNSSDYSGYSFTVSKIVGPNTSVTLSNGTYDGAILLNGDGADNVTFMVEGTKGLNNVYKTFVIKVTSE